MFHHAHNIRQGHNSIGMVQVYQLPASAVGPPYDLLGYEIPETVLFLFDHPVLCRNLFGRPRLLPQLKVPDFPDMECE